MKRKILNTGVVAAAILSVATGNGFYRAETNVIPRALPANAPNGYAPQTNDCPSNTPKIREASSISTQEATWLSSRRRAIREPLRDLLSRTNITGFNTDDYINSLQLDDLPNVGIAISGGGYRAMLTGAGVLQAYDSRTPGSTSSGHLGGLLQSATYLSALSGGSWLVGSMYTNNFTSVNDILARDAPVDKDYGGDIWQFANSIFEGPDKAGIQLFNSLGYYSTLVDDVLDKHHAGYNVSITDYWGRALSFQLFNATNGGPSYTFSSIADQAWFNSGSSPCPFLVTDGRAPGEVLVSSNATVYHFSPWELGTEDPTVYGFAPLKYVGTDFEAGEPASGKCATGFDNVGFVIGTSSSLFNTFLTIDDETKTSGFLSTSLKDAISALFTVLGKDDLDISNWQPNPFYRYNPKTNINADSSRLTLVDGGEDGQNIPLHPLIQPSRHVDVIFAVDSSADTNSSFPASDSAANWPGGLSLIATYERSLAPISNGTKFPIIPDANTFFNLGLNNQPTFFGCSNSSEAPLIVYLPNAPYVFNANVSTFDLAYNDTERDYIIRNGYNLATQGNATLDSEWNACVGCAILSRSLDRSGHEKPSICTRCFDQYCWYGMMDSRKPSKYSPHVKLDMLSFDT